MGIESTPVTTSPTVGYVKWFKPKEGFGFVQTFDGEDIFFNSNTADLEDWKGKVEFDITTDGEGRRVATNVRKLSTD